MAVDWVGLYLWLVASCGHYVFLGVHIIHRRRVHDRMISRIPSMLVGIVFHVLPSRHTLRRTVILRPMFSISTRLVTRLHYLLIMSMVRELLSLSLHHGGCNLVLYRRRHRRNQSMAVTICLSIGSIEHFANHGVLGRGAGAGDVVWLWGSAVGVCLALFLRDFWLYLQWVTIWNAWCTGLVWGGLGRASTVVRRICAGSCVNLEVIDGHVQSDKGGLAAFLIVVHCGLGTVTDHLASEVAACVAVLEVGELVLRGDWMEMLMVLPNHGVTWGSHLIEGADEAIALATRSAVYDRTGLRWHKLWVPWLYLALGIGMTTLDDVCWLEEHRLLILRSLCLVLKRQLGGNLWLLLHA